LLRGDARLIKTIPRIKHIMRYKKNSAEKNNKVMEQVTSFIDNGRLKRYPQIKQKTITFFNGHLKGF